MLKNLAIYILVTVVLLFIPVQTKICTKKIVSTYMVTGTATYSYMTRAKNGTGWGIDVKTTNRLMTKWHIITFCCNGDGENYNDTEVRKSCKPMCNSTCTNGYCAETGRCACNVGYTWGRNNTCVPLCENGCRDGTCVAPNWCRCDPGFAFYHYKGRCEPIAATPKPIIEPCFNGFCPSLNCLPGYKESENVCKPYCSSGCPNGFCVAPEMCFCDPGWLETRKENGANYICIPKCNVPCGNGTCVYPDTCRCFPGYQVNHFRQSHIRSYASESVCVPHCKDCRGDCVAPNFCVTKNSTLSYETTRRLTSRIPPFNTTRTYKIFNYDRGNVNATTAYLNNINSTNSDVATRNKTIDTGELIYTQSNKNTRRPTSRIPPFNTTTTYKYNYETGNVTATTASYVNSINVTDSEVVARNTTTDTVKYLVDSINPKVDVIVKVMPDLKTSQAQQNGMSILISIIIGKFNTSCSATDTLDNN